MVACNHLAYSYDGWVKHGDAETRFTWLEGDDDGRGLPHNKCFLQVSSCLISILDFTALNVQQCFFKLQVSFLLDQYPLISQPRSGSFLDVILFSLTAAMVNEQLQKREAFAVGGW